MHTDALRWPRAWLAARLEDEEAKRRRRDQGCALEGKSVSCSAGTFAGGRAERVKGREWQVRMGELKAGG